jgi:DNA-directed RNA polymerase subunit delta
MGGFQVPGHGSGDDGYDEDGFDESQRAEILEATRNGPNDGTVMTDLDPDLGEDDIDDEAEEDELLMEDDEVGELDDERRESEDDMEEDEVQEDFEDGTADEDDLDDSEEDALEP